MSGFCPEITLIPHNGYPNSASQACLQSPRVSSFAALPFGRPVFVFPQPASGQNLTFDTHRLGLESSSRPEEFHVRALPEPCMTLSSHTAPDVQPLLERLCLAHGLLPSPVGPRTRLNNAAPSVQLHYRASLPTTSCSAPVLRFGTLVLAVCAAWTSPLASERQVLTFHTKAWSSFAPPTCRMPLGQYQGIPRADPGGRVTPRF